MPYANPAVRKAHNDKRYAKRKAAGICHGCGKPARKGKVQCVKCAAKGKARYAKHRAAATSGMYVAQGGKCAACRGLAPSPRWLTIDHIVPRKKGGGDNPSNLQLLCHYCNSVKHARPQSALIAHLREQGIIDAAGNNIEAGYSA